MESAGQVPGEARLGFGSRSDSSEKGWVALTFQSISYLYIFTPNFFQVSAACLSTTDLPPFAAPSQL